MVILFVFVDSSLQKMKCPYTDWSTRDDIKANLQVDLILLLDEFDYPPVTIDDVYKEVLEQAENFKKYAD
jgi:type I restriction enzyme R subunit